MATLRNVSMSRTTSAGGIELLDTFHFIIVVVMRGGRPIFDPERNYNPLYRYLTLLSIASEVTHSAVMMFASFIEAIMIIRNCEDH